MRKILLVGLSSGLGVSLGLFLGIVTILASIKAEPVQSFDYISPQSFSEVSGAVFNSKCGLEPCIDTSGITEPLGVDLEKAENTGGLLVTELGTLQY